MVGYLFLLPLLFGSFGGILGGSLALGAETPQKASWTATLIRSSPSTGPNGYSYLTFSDSKILVTLMPGKEKLRPLVEIHGHYHRPGWELFAQNVSLLGNDAEDSAAFKVFAYLNARITEITFTGRGPGGETESEQVLISAPEAQEYRMSSPWGELMVSLGTASLNYYQQGYGQFSSKTGVLSLIYVTPKWGTPRWYSRLGLYAQTKATMLSWSSSPVGLGPQIVGGKIDGTFIVTPHPYSRLQVSMVFGGSYLTMLSNGSPFGFANLMGPEIGARSTYALGGATTSRSDAASSLNADLRYVPLGQSLEFSLRGIDLSLGWSRRLSNLHRVQIDLGLSDYSYLADASTLIKTNMLSMTFGYSI